MPAMPGTWGELLAILDRREAIQQRLVTAVRLDGVGEPDFRGPALAGRGLATIRRVDVDTTPRAARLADCCEDAAQAAATIAVGVTELASRLRLQAVADGRARLLRLAVDLRGFLTPLRGVIEACGSGLDWLEVDGLDVDDQTAQLGDWLGSLLAAQEDGDWITVADILEYDLGPALQGWACRLRNLAAATDPQHPRPA